MICAGCSTNSGVRTASDPVYEGVPAGMLAPCRVQDIPLKTVADIVASRQIYVEGLISCAAQIDAIRKHDAEARASYGMPD